MPERSVDEFVAELKAYFLEEADPEFFDVRQCLEQSPSANNATFVLVVRGDEHTFDVDHSRLSAAANDDTLLAEIQSHMFAWIAYVRSTV